MDFNSNSTSKFSPRKHGKKFVFDPPPEAPIFRPTIEEFKVPLEYIKKIRPIGEKTGICKIVPPVGWKTPFALDMNTLTFTPRIQRINELEARTRIKLNFNQQLTKFFALNGKTFHVPQMEKVPLDLYTLHRKVKELGGSELVTKEKKWGDVALSLGFTCKTAPTTVKTHYDNLILPFLQSQACDIEKAKGEDKEIVIKMEGDSFIDSSSPSMARGGTMIGPRKGQTNMRELKSLRFLGPGPKMAVCDGGALQKGLRTRGKKIMYEFDPLAKYMCKGCKRGDIEETLLVMCISCEDRYHHSCLIPPLSPDNSQADWRCPKCVAADSYKPLEDFGFHQAERQYTLNQFKSMANEFKRNYFNMEPDDVDHSIVEQEFWRVVSSVDEAVLVEYGADLHVIEHGSGFPRLDQPCVQGVDVKKFEKYAKSPWNLNNLPILQESVLKHISANISGMTVPWMYAGMCFATFCWHIEDHWSYSINYLHLGEAKTWYGVPGSYAEQFEAAMQEAAPELFECQPDLLHQLVTIMNPNDIMAAGVPVYRTDQKRGEFVITFPRAYHAGFNQGFNFAEACNFAPSDWLVIGRECINHYSQLRRTCVFSHDELVCKMALNFNELERGMVLVLSKDMSMMIDAERLRRIRALQLGVGNADCVQFDKMQDDERQCCICNTTVFLSAVSCPCEPTRLVCLDHISKLCDCSPANYVMKYQVQLDLLRNMLGVISSKLCRHNNWSTRVREALACNKSKITLRALTALLIEVKEKEFPPNDLIETLEYHVRRCLECAALSRALVANCNQKKSPSKITVEDLEMFHQEIEKLPCIISEEAAVKEILNKAKKFQQSAERALSLKDVSKPCLFSVIEMGQSLNLDLPELGKLEQKLCEFEWADKVGFAINLGASLDVVEELSDEGKTYDDTPAVVTARSELKEYINNKSEWATASAVPMTVDNHVSTPLLLHDVHQNTPNKSTNDLERTLRDVLSGTDVRYLKDLEELVLQAKQQIPNSDLFIEFDKCVTVARNWVMAAKALFLKTNDLRSLMEALWPRKFGSRHLFFSKEYMKKAPEFESLVDSTEANHYSKQKYKEALVSEYHSLAKLRIDNIRKLDVDASTRIKCLCGDGVDGPAVVCELCHTTMHLECFRATDSSRYANLPLSAWEINFRLRRLCGFCKRTNRPPLKAVRNLAETVEALKVKIPECFAVLWLVQRVERWRQGLLAAINPTTLRERSLEILRFFKKLHVQRHNSTNKNQPDDNLTEESRLIISIPGLLPKETLVALKEELIMGNRLEITPPELNDLWNVLNPTWIHSEVMSHFFNSVHLMRGQLRVGPVQKGGELSPTQESISRPGKSNRFQPGFTSLAAVRKKRKLSVAGSPKKRRIKLIEASSSGNTEEHEPEANCAATTCLKPGDEALDWVQCDACERWFHMKCVDVNRKDVKDEFEYVCANCVCNRVYAQVTKNLASSNEI